MKTKTEIIKDHYLCTCDEMYKSRNMTDPNCILCEHGPEIELIMDEYASEWERETTIRFASDVIKPFTTDPKEILMQINTKKFDEWKAKQ